MHVAHNDTAPGTSNHHQPRRQIRPPASSAKTAVPRAAPHQCALTPNAPAPRAALIGAQHHWVAMGHWHYELPASNSGMRPPSPELHSSQVCHQSLTRVPMPQQCCNLLLAEAPLEFVLFFRSTDRRHQRQRSRCLPRDPPLQSPRPTHTIAGCSHTRCSATVRQSPAHKLSCLEGTQQLLAVMARKPPQPLSQRGAGALDEITPKPTHDCPRQMSTPWESATPRSPKT
mmetsp:Transcript_49612/g.116045  ORF Transcript_49612/g.116045 Transcript_49612/m.116045 type:complete len:229 (+) Transcript_49612:742-1428(+)